MNLRAELTAERVQLLELLRTLSDEEWMVPSLCAGWRIRDVVAHLLWDTVTVPRYLRVGANYRRPDRVNQYYVDAAKSLSTAELLAQFEAMTRTGGWFSRIVPGSMLADLVVHQQDIRRPLRRPRDIERPRLLHALNRPNRFGHPNVFRRGLRFTATDVTWSIGRGPEVRGTGEALALISVGRAVVLDELDGDGVAVLQSRLASRAKYDAR